MSILIATKVLAKASLFDHRINVTQETVLAWAECFEGAKVWPREALDAVTLHYTKPNPFPIMPGDVIAHCEAQPVWSSNEHASEFLDKWARYPYSPAIADYTGVQPPAITIPDDVPIGDEREYRVEMLQKWIAENRGVLVGAILSHKFKPLELES